MVDKPIQPVNIIHVHGTIGVNNSKAVWMDFIYHLNQFKEFQICIVQGIDSLHKEFVSFGLDDLGPSYNFVIFFVVILFCKTESNCINGCSVKRFDIIYIAHSVIDKCGIYRTVLLVYKRLNLINICKESTVSLIIEFS